MTDRATYVFGPRRNGGLIGSATPVEIVAIATAAVAVVGVMFAAQLTLSSAVLILVIAGFTGWFVLTRSGYGDRRSHQCAVVFRYVRRRLRGQTAFQTGTGQTMPFLHGVAIHPTVADGRQVAVVAADGMWVTVRRVHGVMWDLSGGDEALSWGTALDKLGAAGSGVARMMVITRTVPTATLTLVNWWLDNATDEYPDFSRAYIDLLDHEVTRTSDTEQWLVIAVSARSLRLTDHLDHNRRHQALLRGAVEVAERAGATVAVGVPGSVIEPLLGVDAMMRFFQSAWSPGNEAGRAWNHPTPRQDHTDEPVGLDAVLPAAAGEGWGMWATPAALHRVLWVEEYPRTPTFAGFLWPLILKDNAARTVAQVYEPMTRTEALRAAVAAVTHDRSDELERHTKGKHVAAETRQAITAAKALEQDVTNGRVGWRLNTHIVVSAETAADLDTWVNNVTDLAGEARIRVRPLDGQHAEAFTFGLPLCRGLT